MELGLICVSDKYVSVKDNLEFICPECGQRYFRNFDNIKQRKKIICNDCSAKKRGKDQRFSYEYVKNFIEVESKSGCELISEEYVYVDNKMDLICKCGNKFKVSFYDFKNMNKRQCSKCGHKIISRKLATPVDEIKEIVEKEGYEYIDNDLSGGDQKILIRCDNNHSPYWVTVAKFKNDRRCPHCNRSLGEDYIRNELEKYSIEYQREYIFKDLKGINGGNLRFDFALFKNNKIIKLIEYDGKQHFEPSFGSDCNFERIKKHDELKNEYVENNNIPLTRIPYYEYENIPKIIKDIFDLFYKNKNLHNKYVI